MSNTVRVAAIQARRRTISYKVRTPEAALKQVSANLDQLVALAERAVDTGCEITAFPEDTLGTLEWEASHWQEAAELFRPAEKEALSRFGHVAAKHGMYIIYCNDCAEGDDVYNTSILIGRDGRPIGRYRKVQLPITEQSRVRGDGFPVFEAPGIGTIGMCICYDMMFPETTRALALAGADIVFHSTMGGASLAGPEASLACFRARAAEGIAASGPGGSVILPIDGRIENKLTVHPDWPSFNTPQGKAIRYGAECCPRTIDIIGRLGGVIMDPNFTDDDVKDIIAAIRKVYMAMRTA